MKWNDQLCNIPPCTDEFTIYNSDGHFRIEWAMLVFVLHSYSVYGLFIFGHFLWVCENWKSWNTFVRNFFASIFRINEDVQRTILLHIQVSSIVQLKKICINFSTLWTDVNSCKSHHSAFGQIFVALKNVNLWQRLMQSPNLDFI